MKKTIYLLGVFLLLAMLAGGFLYAYAATEETPVASQPPKETPSPMVALARTPSVAPRASASASASPTLRMATETALPSASPTPSPTVSPTPGPNYMRFHTQAAEIPLFQGPGSFYPRQGVAPPESTLLVVGRTGDGVWWMVCCVEGKSGWLRYDPKLLLADGDITLVAIMSVPPTVTVPPVVVAIAVAPTAPPASVATAAPDRAAPVATATLPGNPACKIAGASYSSLPVVGAPNTRPASQDPEFNLFMRGYERTDSYLELMGYLGDTDPDAPQLFMLFADNRTPVFRALYRVRQWNWGCNCPGIPITD
ncbi:MAG: hypothetical protein H0T73_18160, partial [Ardenticatenales bacterium]|nr:hypothetical protein [Ardenticatenales bacterium]